MLFSNLISPGDTIACGDIHANYDLFSQFLDWVKGSGANVILLGDMIDRGPQDLEVLDTVKTLLANPGSHGLASFRVIRGNHEQMLLDASTGHTADQLLWYQNGGNIELQDKVFAHCDWIAKLPLYIIVKDTLFVHAGIVPGVPMPKQDPNELVWIRHPFLNSDLQLDRVFPGGTIKRVVHGHSPFTAPLPDVCGQRIGIDTGAYFSGVLTAFNATRSRFWAFERD
jgi:serine/threonine protein phosphatase 1